MSRPGCQQTSAKPCNRNAEESFPVLSLKSQEQKPPNPLLIQDKNALQPRLPPPRAGLPGHVPAPHRLGNALERTLRLASPPCPPGGTHGRHRHRCALPVPSLPPAPTPPHGD